MKAPRVQFANSPGGKIAFQLAGDGPIDLAFFPYMGWNLDMIWEHPGLARYLQRLASFSRLILFCPRGYALSDPIPLGDPPTHEEWTTDFRYVMDAASSDRTALMGVGESGPGLMMFAAAFPERTSALVLVNSFATLQRHDDYPWGMPADLLERFRLAVSPLWGTGEIMRAQAPELADDERFIQWCARLERGTVSPATYAFIRRMVPQIDVRGVLPSIQAPTLVISHEGDPYIRPGHGRYLAEHIPNARLAERPGFFGVYWLHDVDWVLDEVQSFLTGARSAASVDDRVLATILFTDIVGSTRQAAELGDERWRTLLDAHDEIADREIERYRGRRVKSTGDGILAIFDGPARGIRCALSIRDEVRSLGLDVRTGLHTGEVELRGEDITGIAVAIAARVMSEATAGTVLVSEAVPPLVAGSGILFEDRGRRTLKGLPGEWRLHAAST